MKIKVNKASGVVLDWLVAKCEGKFIRDTKPLVMIMDKHKDYSYSFQPSCQWAQGGPIIEREKLELRTKGNYWQSVKRISAEHEQGDSWLSQQGKTPLVAAMRCYVASKLGDEVEVPVELET